MAVNRECNNVQHVLLNVTGAIYIITIYIITLQDITLSSISGVRLNLYQTGYEGGR